MPVDPPASAPPASSLPASSLPAPSPNAPATGPSVAAGIRAVRNPAAAPRSEPYGRTRARVLDQAGFDAARRAVTAWPGYRPTPLVALPALAAACGVRSIAYKDEGVRFALRSFKALGGAYAVERIVARAGRPDRITVTCATDGNHGRSVAWGAQRAGCRCVIFVHEGVSEGRRAAIAAFGAEVVRVAGNYDDSVRHAEARAREHGWTVVSDTTWDGYRDIPIDVMHGYGVMAAELFDQLDDAPPTHVFVQAGVGALAAAIAAAFWLHWGERRPALVVVEPTAADCHQRSALAGRPSAVTGTLDTLMAGLACGEVSPAAWEIVGTAADAFVAIDDRFAVDAMRRLALPLPGDRPIVAGETGAAGLAALLAAGECPSMAALLGIDAGSRILLLGSEGDTDPAIYRQLTGRGADEVRAQAEMPAATRTEMPPATRAGMPPEPRA